VFLCAASSGSSVCFDFAALSVHLGRIAANCGDSAAILWRFVGDSAERPAVAKTNRQGYFFEAVAPQYEIPSDTTMKRLTEQLDAEVTTRLHERLRAGGPWALTADGASSGDHSLVAVNAHDAFGNTYFLGCVDGGHKP